MGNEFLQRPSPVEKCAERVPLPSDRQPAPLPPMLTGGTDSLLSDCSLCKRIRLTVGARRLMPVPPGQKASEVSPVYSPFEQPPGFAPSRSSVVVVSWDLWIDYHRRDGDGLTHASVKDLSHGVSIVVGQLISVGNEEADPALAEMVSIDERGIVLVRVLPGTLEHNRSRRPLGGTSAS